MTDSLNTSSSSTSSNDTKNDNSCNAGVKREVPDDFGENNNAKIKKLSTEQHPNDPTSPTIEPTSETISTTPLKGEISNNTATDNSDDKTNINSDHGGINATAMATPDDNTLLRDQNKGATTTATALSSLLTNQQHQQFLQTYAQVSGLDLAQLTASSLAQAMISPISMPGFHLLQQLQSGGGSVITALPGPPAEFGLAGNNNNNNHWTLQHPSLNSTETDGNRRISSSDNTSDTKNDTAAPSLSMNITGSPPFAQEMTSTAAAAAAAAAARTISNDERRQRRLLRNRLAAKECRKKKKEYIQDMELKIRRLEEQNATLRLQLDDITNKLALSTTMQGPESYRLMKEVEELNAKLGIGHLAATTTVTTASSSSAIKDGSSESIPTIVDSSSAPSLQISASSSSTDLSALGSTQQQQPQETSSSNSASSLPLSTLASTSTSASTSTPFSLSTPIPTAIPTTVDLSSTTTTTNQPIKSPPVSPPSTCIALSPSSPPKLSAIKLESADTTSLSSPTINILHTTESTTVKMENKDQQKQELDVE